MIWKPRRAAYDMVVLGASAMVESLFESQFTEQLDSLLNIRSHTSGREPAHHLLPTLCRMVLGVGLVPDEVFSSFVYP